MTRAEEKALELFPVRKVPFYGLACNAYSEKDANLDKRALFCMGYEQAEKDLALTWQDIAKIDDMLREVENCIATSDLPTMGREEYYTEVLKRYNGLKKK